MSRVFHKVVCFAAVVVPAVGIAQGGTAAPELASQLDQIASQLKTTEENLRFVETQYTERPEPTDDEARLRRFSDGEIQYLLGDYPNASVLFYDLVADNRFRHHPKYPDALFYLSDSLYQQKNYVGAKLYLRELLGLQAGHYKEALGRYLEIAGRLNEFAGIDEYIQQAKGLSGELPPELAYVYGKWMFKRADLPLQQRMKRAMEIFTPLASAAYGSTRLQSAYFIGVGYVKLGQLDLAIEQFRKITIASANGEREVKVKELANLSLGRLLYETGQFDAALDRYQEIPRESEYFVDSLYEIAWAQVKKNEYERAKNATDILLLVAPESTIAPEAQILQGHLLLKLKRYGDATDTYNQVINTYAPVRDEIEALLKIHKDPVRYFDDLLAKNEKNLDVASLLPPVALKWATTQKEVADAVQMVSDLEAGRRGVQESGEIANRILKALDERGLETFPALQEGYTRADAVDSALTQIDEGLVRIEGALVADKLSPEERARLDRLKGEQASLQERFHALPTNEREVESRKQRMQERVDEVDKSAFKLGYEIQSMFAVLTAVEKWVEDTRTQRKNTPEDEKVFLERLHHETAALNVLQRELDELRQKLSEEKASADAVLGGEEIIRRQYADALKELQQIIAAAEGRLGPDARAVYDRAAQVRRQAEGLRARVETAKKTLRDQVARRGKVIRDTVRAEQTLLGSYDTEVGQVSGHARDLVGRIVVDSFGRVRRQFYELVLKADVGVVDVAFTRKQDKTAQIQKLSSQKDRELRSLDEEFREVLQDVD
ncbi:MAG: hypothetical protein ACOZIN_15200 [Myxococcota bacterium]